MTVSFRGTLMAEVQRLDLIWTSSMRDETRRVKPPCLALLPTVAHAPISPMIWTDDKLLGLYSNITQAPPVARSLGLPIRFPSVRFSGIMTHFYNVLLRVVLVSEPDPSRFPLPRFLREMANRVGHRSRGPSDV